MKKIKFYFAAFSFVMLINFSFASECQSGGPGSDSCSASYTIGASVAGSGGETTSSASTSCKEGYYSCCNAGPSGASATCEKE